MAQQRLLFAGNNLKLNQIATQTKKAIIATSHFEDYVYTAKNLLVSQDDEFTQMQWTLLQDAVNISQQIMLNLQLSEEPVHQSFFVEMVRIILLSYNIMQSPSLELTVYKNIEVTNSKFDYITTILTLIE